MQKVALITGVTGQDGIYLSELLLGKGYRVIGAVRDIQNAIEKLPAQCAEIELVEWDMFNQLKVTEILTTCRPTEIYNFAAYSTGAGMYDDPVGIEIGRAHV